MNLNRFQCMRVGQPWTTDEVVTVVSGLPRSGTSMMMRMLTAGGLPALTDGLRQSDRDNPHGYFEYEAVKEPSTYLTWLPLAQGKVVKMVSRFLPRLPATQRYRIIFMRRPLMDVLRSQQAMAHRYSGAQWEGRTVNDLTALYHNHVQQCLDWARERPNVELIEVDYEDVLASPSTSAQRIAQFLCSPALDLDAMSGAVDHQLNHGTTAREKQNA